MREEKSVMTKRRGIALISVFIVSGVMMILLGGFVRVNMRNFDLLNNDLRHITAEETARSAYDYCMFRLEDNRRWGTKKFDGDKDQEVKDYLDVTLLENKTKIEGSVVGADATFEVKILNNIDGDATVDGVEKGDCRLRIVATSGSARVSREVVLGTAPLFDGSVIASDGIYVDADHLNVASTDPLRNRIRSKKGINVPDYKDNFSFNPAAKANEKGVLWAKDGIQMGGKRLTDSNYAREAQNATGGQFLTKADTFYDVYDLQLSEIKENSNIATINSGVYVFGQRTVAYESGGETKNATIPVLERRDWSLDSDGNLGHGDVREVWYLPRSLPSDATNWRVGLYGDLPENGLHAETDNTFPIDSGVQVHFNSIDPLYASTQQKKEPPSIVINSDVNLEVNGDFGVASDSKDYRPTIKFQDPETGAVGTDNHGNIESGSITAKAANGKPGSIYLEGAIFGNGKLLADGDVTVKNTFANVSSDSNSDLSIFSGGSVSIRPQKARDWDDKTIFGGQDWDGSTAFRGLVFARDSVSIEADKNNDPNVMEKTNVYIEGAVVARNGKVAVYNAKDVEFRYNPSYLDSILKPNKESRVRLERVVWKEY